MSSLGKQKEKVAQINSPYVKYQEERTLSSIKRRKGLIRRLTFFFLFTLLITGLVVSTLLSRQDALEEKRSQKEELVSEHTRLTQQELFLQDQILKLNDDEYISKLARKDYFLSDKGEIIFNLPEN